MGRDARIDVQLRGSPSVIDSVEALRSAGWGFEPNRVITHLPLGDGDRFAWQDAAVEDWPAVRLVFEQKARNGEVVGVELLWERSQIGASFLFYPDLSVTVGLLGNRPRLPDTDGVADMSWFLSRLLPAWLKTGAVVASVECHDNED